MINAFRGDRVVRDYLLSAAGYTMPGRDYLLSAVINPYGTGLANLIAIIGYLTAIGAGGTVFPAYLVFIAFIGYGPGLLVTPATVTVVSVNPYMGLIMIREIQSAEGIGLNLIPESINPATLIFIVI